jgi:hypothetical protein
MAAPTRGFWSLGSKTPNGRFWIGKWDSGETSIKLLRAEFMNPYLTEGNQGDEGFVICLGYVCYLLF